MNKLMSRNIVVPLMLITIILVSFAIHVPNTMATNYYVDNSATGLGNGTSWTNAWTSFSDINWGSIQPGDIIYISGGTTSKTYREQLSIGASGVSGNPVTVKVGQDYGHTGTVILEGGAEFGINTGTMSWVTVSGQLGSNSTPNMIVRNHNNDEIRLETMTGVVIEYLEVGPNTVDDCIHVVNNYIGGNNRISNNKIHNCYDYGIVISPPSGNPVNDKHLRIDHNEIYNLGHDAIHAGAGAGGLTIDHNKIHDVASTGTTYVDGMHLRGMNYITVAYNEIYDLENPYRGMHAYIYVECDSNQSNVAANDNYIYNNFIYQNTTTSGTASHVGIKHACKFCASMTRIFIYNNTIVDLMGWGIVFQPNQASGNTSNTIIANNIIYNNSVVNSGGSRPMVALHEFTAGIPTTGSFGDTPTPDIIWDYNLVDTYSSGTVSGNFNETTSNYSSWRTACGCDDHGVTTDPIFKGYSSRNNVTENLYLRANDTSAIDKGIATTIFNDDFVGTLRPQGSAWDIGANEYLSQQGTVPNPPSNLR